MKVTGFHLVGMCHWFGLRTRAMIRSLEMQVGAPQIWITVFWSRSYDFYCLEMAEGRNVRYSMNRVEESGSGNNTLFRAKLFNSVKPTPQPCSHTIFADFDCWFPPDFFANYASALESNPPGYYSAFVHNVMMPDAQKLVTDEWETLTPARLDQFKQPWKPDYQFRHDDRKGKVGTFQCIPTGLCAYPCDKFQGMAYADYQFAEMSVALSDDKRDERRIGSPCYHIDHKYAFDGISEQM